MPPGADVAAAAAARATLALVNRTRAYAHHDLHVEGGSVEEEEEEEEEGLYLRLETRKRETRL